MSSDHSFWLSREQVRELDRRASDEFGVPGIVLMENAGRGCAELLMRLNSARSPVMILCGPGNNGGDGFVIARHLDNHGWPVSVFFLSDRAPTPGDAAINYSTAQRCGLLPAENNGLLSNLNVNVLGQENPGWIVDALFGTGLSRPLSAPYDQIVDILNASRQPILAVDIPTGLDCDSGVPLGPTVRATHTATFVAAKKGFQNPESRSWTGEIHIVDIGAPRLLVEDYRRQQPPSTASI